ncbi:MAG: hypothetical protein HY815_24350 [Candidatus Riflebacteria bacterium]|nr:hypothetical protein [Candidatus Riflebacteria bacterium]
MSRPNRCPTGWRATIAVLVIVLICGGCRSDAPPVAPAVPSGSSTVAAPYAFTHIGGAPPPKAPVDAGAGSVDAPDLAGRIIRFDTRAIAGEAYEVVSGSGTRAATAPVSVTLVHLKRTGAKEVRTELADRSGADLPGVSHGGHAFRFECGMCHASAPPGLKAAILVRSADRRRTRRLGPVTITGR